MDRAALDHEPTIRLAPVSVGAAAAPGIQGHTRSIVEPLARSAVAKRIVDRRIDRWYSRGVTSRLAVLAVLAQLVACKTIYDAQYDERASELEKQRVVFQPSSAQVQFFTAADRKLYWVTLEKPLDQPLLHSIDPSTGTQVDYEFTRADTNIANHYKMSDSLVVRCGFSRALAFDAAASNRQLDMTDQSSDTCAVAGGDAYFLTNRKILKWTPGQGAPAQVLDLDAARVGTGSIDGFGVIGKHLLLAEGGRLWLVDLTTATATWLENANAVSQGSVVFDDRGVFYNSSAGVMYSRFADHTALKLQDAVADGGYDLNFEHGDAQNVADVAEFALFGQYVIYRGVNGIFAYGLDTKKVIDILLDRGTGFDASPLYRTPTVTRDGILFVEDQPELNSTKPTLYRVDVTARLR